MIDCMDILEIDYIKPTFVFQKQGGTDIVEDVYNNRQSWSDVKDNYIYTFVDGTQAIMKKFVPITTKEVATSSSNTQSPREEEVSVILPILEYSDSPTTSASTSTIFLDCRDCANITKVTQYDFQKGDYLEGGVEYLFSFGEVAYDTVSDRVVVVVGHRKTKVYAVSGFSIIQNFCTDVAITPYSRSTWLLRTVASAANALNYRVVRECADMEQYVIHNSEKAYRL